ncbi:hypothetical protein V5T82_02485 [Magnetovibrio sp. PR-2]|uniref:hypothetical protein n=1 Tax=Magnetovibrio sp. PR-2 TaxID=3120356 RepID=UPI002FCE489F
MNDLADKLIYPAFLAGALAWLLLVVGVKWRTVFRDKDPLAIFAIFILNKIIVKLTEDCKILNPKKSPREYPWYFIASTLLIFSYLFYDYSGSNSSVLRFFYDFINNSVVYLANGNNLLLVFWNLISYTVAFIFAVYIYILFFGGVFSAWYCLDTSMSNKYYLANNNDADDEEKLKKKAISDLDVIKQKDNK